MQHARGDPKALKPVPYWNVEKRGMKHEKNRRTDQCTALHNGTVLHRRRAYKLVD